MMDGVTDPGPAIAVRSKFYIVLTPYLFVFEDEKLA